MLQLGDEAHFIIKTPLAIPSSLSREEDGQHLIMTITINLI